MSGALLAVVVAGQWADYWAREFQVPAELVRAVIEVESAWQPAAMSAKGAAGLMQLMPATAERFGVRNRFDIAENTRGGVAYLAELLRMFDDDWRLAVAGYYTGEGRIRRQGLQFSDPEVFRYVSEVGRRYWRLRRARKGENSDAMDMDIAAGGSSVARSR